MEHSTGTQAQEVVGADERGLLRVQREHKGAQVAVEEGGQTTVEHNEIADQLHCAHTCHIRITYEYRYTQLQ